MLISPPFLPDRTAAQTEDAWLDAAMPGGAPGDGGYPLGARLAWHGGVHLEAPEVGGQPLPVRCIADGTVVYVRAATAPVADAGHALNHGGGWTSDGVVLVRHETEVGEGAGARVTFFSLYVHLAQVRAGLAAGTRVSRKAELGDAGQVYGSTRRKLHLEVLCDDDNVARLVGRAAGDLDVTRDGRTDALYGEAYTRLPAGTAAYAQQPAGNVAAPAAAPAATTAEVLFVGLRYERGQRILTTYRGDGTAVGAPLVTADAEYALLTDARALRAAHPANARPTHAALYELLRFGRAVQDPLTPANVPHWQQVALPAGPGWVDLNAAGTTHCSDADFPHWRGWTLVDDSADGDCRCDSPTLRGWLDADGNGEVSTAEVTARLADAGVAARLARAICKFPTEWDGSAVDARWGWLRTRAPENPNPLTQAEYARLADHVRALCFWQQANVRAGGQAGAPALPASHWRFHPREFICAMRRCEWLSADELARCLPRQRAGGAAIPWAQARARAATMAPRLNRLLRAFIGPARHRHVHVLAQVYTETAMLRSVSEFGQGAGHAYGAFYGRGLMQLTWPTNYAAYGAYKGLPDQAAPAAYQDGRITVTSQHDWARGAAAQAWAPRYDPDVVATDDVHAADSGGFYWLSKPFRGTSNLNRACDHGLGPNVVGFVSWLVNGGDNGYAERQQFARYVANVLLDAPPLVGVEAWAYPPLGPQLHGVFPPGNPGNTQNVQVDHAPQVP